MATSTVEYTDVAPICNQLFGHGNRNPSALQVREQLKLQRSGSGLKVGSPNTIHRHVLRWRQNERPADPAPAPPELPPIIATALQQVIDRAVNQVREPLAARIEVLTGEMQELIGQEEEAESHIAELQQAITTATQQKDILAGKLAEQIEQNRSVRESLTLERDDLNATRLELAREQVSTKLVRERADEAAVREKSVQSELAHVRSELSKEREERLEWQKKADLLDLKLTNEERSRRDAEARIDQLVDAVRGIETAAGRASAAEASNHELRSHVAMLHSLLEGIANRSPKAGIEVGQDHATSKAPQTSEKPLVDTGISRRTKPTSGPGNAGEGT